MKHLIGIALTSVLAVSSVAQTPALPQAGIPAAVIADPPRDAGHPARNRQLVIPSGPPLPALRRPAEMNAVFLLASGKGPKPTMVLLHGLPGNERNLDLAQAVRRAGWNVLTFTYRGAWGSEGAFSIRHAIEDAAAALAFVRNADVAAEYQVDRSHIVLAGHSMGGLAAALTAARDVATQQARPGKLAGLVLLDAWNAGNRARQLREGGAETRRRFIEGFDDIGHALGRITATDIADELVRQGQNWDLLAHAPALARLPVLTVYATEGLRENNQALAKAIGRTTGARVKAREIESDHAFADRRLALAAEVVGWLR